MQVNNMITTILWNQSFSGIGWAGFILNKWFFTSPPDTLLVKNLGYCYDDSTALGILFIKIPDDIGYSVFKIYNGAIIPTRDKERYLVMAGYNYQSSTYDPYDSLPNEFGYAYMFSVYSRFCHGRQKNLLLP